MGLDDRVYAEVNPEEPRNENLEGGKSSAASKEEAEAEKCLTKGQEKPTAPEKDPDEIKATSDVLPEDAERKTDLSSGDSQN